MRTRNIGEQARRRAAPIAAVADPSDDTAILSLDDSVILSSHQFERDLRNRLMSEPALNFQSLVVRRIENGVCLEGVLEVDDEKTDVTDLVRHVSGIQNVLNCLVVQQPHQIPPKG